MLSTVMPLLLKGVSLITSKQICSDIGFINGALDRKLKNEKRFDLSHALQKLSIQHQDIECLVAFAHFPPFEPVLYCHLLVICIAL